MIGAKARIPNPALKPLGFLVGDWATTGRHPAVEGELRGRSAVDWHEGGAFLLMRTQVDHPQFPDGLAILASDVGEAFAMSYFDERGVSRLFRVEVGERTVTWSRDDAELAQTVTLTAQGDGDTLVSTGRMSQNGGAWGPDLSQVFRRAG